MATLSAPGMTTITLKPTETVMTFGRDPACSITLDSKKYERLVSRHHATLVWKKNNKTGADEWRLSDGVGKKASANGLFVNGIKVKSALLRDGDEIMFGVPTGHKVAFGESRENLKTDVAKYTFYEEEGEEGAGRPSSLKRNRSGLDKAPEGGRKRARTSRGEGGADNDEEDEVDAETKEKLERAVKEQEALKEEIARRDQEKEAMEKRMKEMSESFHERSAREEEERSKVAEESRLETEKNRTEAADELSNLRKELEDQKSGAKGMATAMEDTLSCPFCFGVFVKPCTMTCTHSFCYTCLRDWYAKAEKDGKDVTCMTCRLVPVGPPVLSRALSDAVSVFVETMSVDEKDEHHARSTELQATLDKKYNDLKQGIDLARERNQPFFSIKTKWTAACVDVFHRGVSQYKSTRLIELYCSSTGLSHDYIDNHASNAQINVAAKNVLGNSVGTVAELKARLHRFLTGWL